MDKATSEGNTAISSSTRNETSDSTCPLCGGVGFVVRNVPVGHPDFERLVPCRCHKETMREQYRAELCRMSNIGQLSRMRFDNFKPDGVGLDETKRTNLRLTFGRALAFAENPRGWLVLLGKYGCGKTHLAVAIANARLERGEPALFVVVPDLLDHLRATFAPDSPVSYDEQVEKVRTAPLLILDDLGTESATQWAREKLFQILNHRYNARLPTVVTSNRELEMIDERLRSRMVDPDVSVVMTISAPDFRGGGADLSQATSLSSLEHHADQTFETFETRRNELGQEDSQNLQRALQTAKEFAENPMLWLVLSGPYGCGKTHLAAAIANYRAARGFPALFVVVPDLLDHLRATFNPTSPTTYDRRFEGIRSSSLLVLDDLGTESATTWAKEKLFQLFNHRYNARLPTVITTSDRPDDIEPRLLTRMLDVTRCTFFVITAPSYQSGSQPNASRNRRKTRDRGAAT